MNNGKLKRLVLILMKGKYDNIAPFYDWLTRLVFGDAVLRAHRFLANAIPGGSSVLIIGGGTGFILEEISKKHLNGLDITYVDISRKMIALSEKRNSGNNKVEFINKSIAEVKFDKQFDAVITPFFLDNFSNKTLGIIHNKINLSLRHGGVWLFADFQQKENKLWQQILLKFMYVFFRLSCNIEATHLEDFDALFKVSNYQISSWKTFYRNFIYSTVYIKQ